jgi:hypothetical protein
MCAIGQGRIPRMPRSKEEGRKHRCPPVFCDVLRCCGSFRSAAQIALDASEEACNVLLCTLNSNLISNKAYSHFHVGFGRSRVPITEAPVPSAFAAGK